MQGRQLYLHLLAYDPLVKETELQCLWFHFRCPAISLWAGKNENHGCPQCPQVTSIPSRAWYCSVYRPFLTSRQLCIRVWVHFQRYDWGKWWPLSWSGYAAPTPSPDKFTDKTQQWERWQCMSKCYNPPHPCGALLSILPKYVYHSSKQRFILFDCLIFFVCNKLTTISVIWSFGLKGSKFSSCSWFILLKVLFIIWPAIKLDMFWKNKQKIQILGETM